MIVVTRINGRELVINAELIEFVESTPDTIVTLTTGRKIIVQEPMEEVIARVIEYQRRIHQPIAVEATTPGGESG